MKNPWIRPSTILGIAASGLPSLRVIVSSVARSLSTRSAGTSSRLRYLGRAKPMWTAMSWASSWEPPATSTSTPLTPRPPCWCRYESSTLPEAASKRTTGPSSMFSLSVSFRSSSRLGELGDRRLALGGDGLGHFLGEALELVRGGDEVGLALQLDDGAEIAVDDQGDGALGVFTVGALGSLAEALLTEPLAGGFHVAVVGLEGLLGIHHAGAGCLAQGLDVFRGERHLGSALRGLGGVGSGLGGLGDGRRLGGLARGLDDLGGFEPRAGRGLGDLGVVGRGRRHRGDAGITLGLGGGGLAAGVGLLGEERRVFLGVALRAAATGLRLALM